MQFFRVLTPINTLLPPLHQRVPHPLKLITAQFHTIPRFPSLSSTATPLSLPHGTSYRHVSFPRGTSYRHVSLPHGTSHRYISFRSKSSSRSSRPQLRTIQRRKKSHKEDLEQMDEDGEEAVKRRPDQVEFGQGGATSRGGVKKSEEHLYKFRKGLDVPRWNSNNWINVFILEPWIAFRGHTIVYFDSHIRLTRAGFYLMHLTSFCAAMYIAYISPDWVFADVQYKLTMSQHLYMIDAAKLLWLQRALENCQAVMNQRVNGMIPGLTLPEALQVESQSPFVTHDYRQQHDILHRTKLMSQLANETTDPKALRMAELRQQHWGNRSPSALDAERERMDRMDNLQQSKQALFDRQLKDTKEDLKLNMDQNKSNFRNKYIQPFIKPPQ